MGEAPDHIVLVETEADVDALDVADPSRVAYISQTTLSVDETRAIITRLRERFPDITGPRTDDICYATTNRQAAVKQMAAHCDTVLVIGSQNSSNSQRLVEVARDHGAESHLINNARQVQEAWLEGKRVVGISSGASAPEEARRGARRPLPLPRRGVRRGVRGRPRGRPLHASQAPARGPGGGHIDGGARPLLADDGSALHRVPRPRMGAAGDGRARALREARAGGASSPGCRGSRSCESAPPSVPRSRTSTPSESRSMTTTSRGSWRTRASCAAGARSRRRSSTRVPPWRCATTAASRR